MTDEQRKSRLDLIDKINAVLFGPAEVDVVKMHPADLILLTWPHDAFVNGRVIYRSLTIVADSSVARGYVAIENHNAFGPGDRNYSRINM